MIVGGHTTLFYWNLRRGGDEVKNIIISIVLVVCIVSGLVFYNMSYFRKVDLDITWETREKGEKENMVLNFINNKLSEAGYGIYTNYINVDNDGDITRGHDVLSESEGLMMIYSVNSGDKELFDEHFNIVKSDMITKKGLISWRVSKTEVSQVSATIDELRVIKALFFAYDRWGDYKYKYYATKISRGLLEHAMYNGNLIDFIDEYGASKDTTLCYLDLSTLRILSLIDDKWTEVYDNANTLLLNGRISDTVPLFKKVYSNESNTYDTGNDVDLLLSLIVILNRVESGEYESEAIKWIEDKFRYYGYLVSTYDEMSGEETSKIESPSIYSLTATIGKLVGNDFLVERSISKLEHYQIKNVYSEFYGGYGNEATKDVYSFDNLNALIAYQKAER